MKGKKLLFIIMACLTLVLAACGGKGEGDANKKEGSSKEPDVSRGNELVIAVSSDPQNWDPIDTFLLDWSTVATSVFEGLVNRTTDLEVGPGLAESWEYTDDKTLVFQLRQNVTFQNGEPFNAEAVKFTFDRLLGEEGQAGPQYANYESIDKVEITGDNEVTFYLKEVDPVLLTKLAGYGASIVPPKYIAEKGDEHFNNNPVGTGPYKMTEYKRDQQAVLERYEAYWNAGAYKVDKVTFKVIPEASTRLAELQSGSVDIMKRVEVAQVDTIKAQDYLELLEVGTPTAYAIRFDTAKAPVDDKRVRQAINYAIDKESIIETILGGYGKQISSFQSEYSFGYNKDLDPYPYDPEKAKALLAEAKVPADTTLEFYLPGNDGNFKEIAQVVSHYLEEVGLKVEIKTADSTTMNSDLIPKGEVGHMYRNGWGGWTLDFDNTAYLMYHEGEFWNPSYKNEKVEKLLSEQRQSTDNAKREAIFKELTEVLYEDAPEVNLYSVVDLYAINKRVEGFVPPHDDRMNFAGVSVK